MKGGPSLIKNEVENLIDFVIKEARLHRSREIFIEHDRLAELMVGDVQWKTVLANKNENTDNINRRKNRIRYKMLQKLSEAGITAKFQNLDSGYSFILADSIELSVTKELEIIHGNGETSTNYVIPYIPHHNFPDLCRQVRRGNSPLLIGDKGCGKSRACEEIARFLGMRAWRVAMGSATEPAELFGFIQIKEEKGVPVSKFTPGLLTVAMQEGYLLIMDEIDALPAHLGLHLHKFLEEGASVHVYTEQGPVEIKKHPNFRIIASANTFGEGDSSGLYAGTVRGNQATFDRFYPKHKMNYDPEIEMAIGKNLVHQNVVDALYRKNTRDKHEGIVHLIRKAIDNEEIYGALSFRVIQNIFRYYYEDGWHKSMLYLMNSFAPSEQDKVSKIITDTMGEEYVPSDNDHDPSLPNYIPALISRIKKNKNAWMREGIV
jgi:hypothetical protein